MFSFKSHTFIFIILLLTGVIYLGTLNHAFQFDDFQYIVNNFNIRNLYDIDAIWHSLGTPIRFFTFYSFALNYHFHGLNVVGYHIVNIVIHFLTGLSVLWLVRLIFDAPVIKAQQISHYKNPIAYFTCLLFIAHPIQTEAVTYIVQRFTSLATFFYVISLCFYLKGRSSGRNSTLFFIGFFISSVLGMFAKQIFFTMPICIFMLEVNFLKLNDKKFLNNVFKVALVVIAALFVVIYIFKYDFSNVFRSMPSRSNDAIILTPKIFFFTQLHVLITYFRLLVFPINQTLYYDYPLYPHFWNFSTVLCFLIHLAIIIFAFIQYGKNRLVSFSILWFYLTISVTSSIIPIPHVIFEHHLYLPSIGFFLLLNIFILNLVRNVRVYQIIMLILVCVFSFLSFERNKVWKSEITMWADVVKKSPTRAKAFNNLGVAYLKEKKFELAIEQFSQAIRINPNGIQVYNNRALAYQGLKNNELAMADLNAAINIYYSIAKPNESKVPLNQSYAEVFVNRAKLYEEKNLTDLSINDYKEALKIDSNNILANYYLGFNSEINGQYLAAIDYYSNLLKIDNQFIEAYIGRGMCFYFLNDFQSAVFNFSKAIDLNINLSSAYFYRAISSFNLGNKLNAQTDMKKAVELGFESNQKALNDLKLKILQNYSSSQKK